MIKVYVSTNKPREDYLSAFKDKVLFTDNLSSCDKLLVFLDSDTKKAKQDINYALDKKKPVVYVTATDFASDRGLEMQLGLEQGFCESDDKENVLSALLKVHENRKKSNKKILIAAICIIAVIAVILGIFLANKSKENRSGVQSEDNTQASDNAQSNDNAQAEIKSEIIEMDEKLLQALIEQNLDIDKNGFISKDELIDVSELQLSGKDISDITGLIYAENLTKLDLSNNKISDIKALVSLKQLEELDITGNNIADYSYLDYLPSIKKISSDSGKKY